LWDALRHSDSRIVKIPERFATALLTEQGREEKTVSLKGPID
jgi:hypothetical protein